MNLLLFNIMIAIGWGAVWGSLTIANLLLGFAVGYGVLWLSRSLFRAEDYFDRIHRIIKLVAYFHYDLVVSSIRVVHDVFTPPIYSKPGIVAVPLTAETDAEILLTANLISLTPGTLSLDVSDDRKTLYVHGMFVEDPEQLKQDLKDGMEAKVLEALR